MPRVPLPNHPVHKTNCREIKELQREATKGRGIPSAIQVKVEGGYTPHPQLKKQWDLRTNPLEPGGNDVNPMGEMGKLKVGKDAKGSSHSQLVQEPSLHPAGSKLGLNSNLWCSHIPRLMAMKFIIMEYLFVRSITQVESLQSELCGGSYVLNKTARSNPTEKADENYWLNFVVVLLSLLLSF